MQSVSDLQNTLLEIQDMINNTINPVFTDLSNVSQTFDPVIISHNTIIQKINEMIAFLNSGVIQGLKGDQGIQGLQGVQRLKGDKGDKGDQGIQGVQGIQGQQGLQGIQGSIPFSKSTVTTTQSSFSTTLADISELSTLNLEANSVYEISCFVTFKSASTTTGINLGLLTPSGSQNNVEITVPVNSIASYTQLRIIFPDAAIALNEGNVLGTGVTAANSNHTALIRGAIVTGATAGVCQIRFASEVNASIITIQPNSYIHLLKPDLTQ